MRAHRQRNSDGARCRSPHSYQSVPSPLLAAAVISLVVLGTFFWKTRPIATRVDETISLTAPPMLAAVPPESVEVPPPTVSQGPSSLPENDDPIPRPVTKGGALPARARSPARRTAPPHTPLSTAAPTTTGSTPRESNAPFPSASPTPPRDRMIRSNAP